MNKISALWNLFRKGECVSNPDAWKTGQITGSMVGGFLAALLVVAKAFGYSVPLTDDQLVTIGGAVVAVVGLFVHPAISAITSPNVGLPAKGNVVSDDEPFAGARITADDVQAGINFANQATDQSGTGRGQNIE
jgi:hypothetical protein